MTIPAALALTATVLWFTALVCAMAAAGRPTASGQAGRETASALLAIGSIVMIAAIWASVGGAS